jgi:hypothetical protein
MGKKPKPKNLKPPGRCILCDSQGVTETHVFPEWLGKLIPFGEYRRERFVRETPVSADEQKMFDKEDTTKQGQVFRVRPKLLCRKCNNYFGRIEDELVNFPSHSLQATTLLSYQLVKLEH